VPTLDWGLEKGLMRPAFACVILVPIDAQSSWDTDHRAGKNGWWSRPRSISRICNVTGSSANRTASNLATPTVSVFCQA